MQRQIQDLIVQGVETAQHVLEGVHALESERVGSGLQAPVSCLLRKSQFLPVIQLHMCTIDVTLRKETSQAANDRTPAFDLAQHDMHSHNIRC